MRDAKAFPILPEAGATLLGDALFSINSIRIAHGWQVKPVVAVILGSGRSSIPGLGTAWSATTLSKEDALDAVKATTDRIVESAKSAGGKAGKLSADTANLITETVRTGSEKSRSAANDFANKASEVAEHSLAASADIAKRAGTAVTQGVQSGSEKVGEASRHLAGKATGLAERGVSATTDIASRSGTIASTQATEAFEAVSKVAARTKQRAEPTARKIAESVTERREQTVEKFKQTAQVVAEGAGSTGKRIQEVTTDVAGQMAEKTQAASETVSESLTEAARWTSVAARQVGSKTSTIATQVSDSVADVVARSYRMSEPVTRKCAESVRASAKHIEVAAHGVLASDLAGSLNAMLAELGKGPPTIYDRAIDAIFIETGIGGTYHRLFDGGHTIWGAFEAVRDAPGDDGIAARALGMALGLFRDGTTPRGLPFFTWDKETYDSVAGLLKESFDIPKDWFYDLLTYDAAEVVGAVGGAMALVFRWNKADSKEFGRIVGSTGLAAVVSANPLLGVVMIAALAKAFAEAHGDGAYEDAIKGLAQGSAGTGAAMAGAALVGAAGGPAGVALIASLGAGIGVSYLAGKAGEKVDLEATGAYIAETCKSAAGSAAKFTEAQFDSIKNISVPKLS